MTVTLNLPPDVEAGLLAQAQSYGLPLEAYLVQHVLREAVTAARPPKDRKSLAQLFAESPLKGLDLDFKRDPDTGRSVSL